MQIRPMSERDWPHVYRFFTAIVDAGETYAYPEGLDSAAAHALWTAPGHVVVAAEDDTVLGSAGMGPNRPGRGAHVATGSFMIDPVAHGRGAGRALGEYLVGWARAAGYRGVQFNAVVETNAPAVHLWQTLGFRIVGTVPGAFRHAQLGYVGLHVMYLDLTDLT